MGNEYIKKQIHHILKGKAIELVPVAKEHMDFICDEESNSELWCYEEYVETNKERIRERFIKRIGESDVFDFIIKRSSDSAQMGAVYIWQCSSTRKSWEIGYVLLPEFQGNGYCLESANLLISFAFNELNAHKVIGMCHCDNLKSASVMQKAGMSKQGVFREEYKCGDKWVDQFYFSILEREYNKNYKKS
ncbi:acetyltransferase domain protein [Clostridium argentinense CDC 2741]|uniref:Acetyltransferase domain protein n=1 Tax=Clostridium argentinense CDC 2741 TaxID=1418104 RepID=A0A0C1R846_9CLOT|nr:GNAT family protein [Clostridium argentinense]ARC86510.1 N-acetyltransferase [Clostridium argentinense]KIE46721.1 acetyltransferase domain protein [Clostridium argentinense CDC 2741]